MESCIYEGRVSHRRFRPVEHRFRMPLFMMYLDLDELPTLLGQSWLCSTHRVAPARFRREDYLGEPEAPLSEAVRGLVASRTGRRPDGPIRLLTHLRYFGHHFSPVSFYYCFAPGGAELQALVADVTNIPWKERHCYVLSPQTPEDRPAVATDRSVKAFHVSPFMGMDMTYDWTLTVPQEHLVVQIQNRSDGEPIFAASLALRRREISRRALLRVLLRYPFITLQVVAGIYWQALRLRRKNAPFFPHPRERERSGEVQPT